VKSSREFFFMITDMNNAPNRLCTLSRFLTQHYVQTSDFTCRKSGELPFSYISWIISVLGWGTNKKMKAVLSELL
jgi:hypothetical protein